MAETKKLTTTDIYNQKGEKVGKVELPEEIFKTKINPDLMAQAVRVYLTNQRQGNASTKRRGEISGGGRKPWRQKGTGRARHGSIRSPIWVKGGVAHGPKPKDWSLKLSKKMKKAALFSALSQKHEEKNIKIIERLDFKKPKTKTAKDLLKILKLEKKVLIVLPKKEENTYLSFRNLLGIDSVIVNQISTYTVLDHEHILMTKDCIPVLAQTFLKQKNKGAN